MKILRGRILPLAALITATATGSSFAQEYFRDFGTSRTSAGLGRLSASSETFEGNNPDGLSPVEPAAAFLEDENYNMRLGNVDFVLAAGLAVEFNDNITLANDDRISDIIFRPQLDIEGVWRISETNRLRFGVSLSYAKYLENDQFDSESILISPTSAITWTAQSGPFTVTIRERLAYLEDAYDVPVLSDIANYRRWENQAGIQVDWSVNEFVTIAVGYDRFDLWTEDVDFESQDRSIDTIFFRPGFKVSPHLTLGVNASVSWVKYDKDIQSDGRSILVGPYALWKVNDYTDVYAEVGYQQTDFDGATSAVTFDPVTGAETGLVPVDNEDASTVYAKIEIRNRPTEFFRHKLGFSKTTELGFGSNYYDLYVVDYTADWKIGENTSLGGAVFYEYYETSGAFTEEASRYGVALSWNHIFSEHLTLGLDYRFVKKDSNLEDSDYYQNLGLVSLYYKF